MNIVQLNDILGTVCMKVPTVHSYYGEDIYEAWNTTEVKYASMAFNLENTRQTDHTRTFEGVLYFADRLTEDKSNCLGIYADADNAIANVLTNLQDATDEGEFSISEYQIVHFQQKFADFLAGGYARIQITVANTCDIVLLTEKVSTIIILEENGEYDVSSYSTAIVAVPPYGEEHDPIFCASAAYTIEATDIRLWNYTADYLNSYVSKSELVHCGYITYADLPDYSNTYQAKGNYVTPEILSAQSYLTQETDPVFSASIAAGITQSDIEYWNRGGSIDLSSYVTYEYLSAQAYVTRSTLPNLKYYLMTPILATQYNRFQISEEGLDVRGKQYGLIGELYPTTLTREDVIDTEKSSYWVSAGTLNNFITDTLTLSSYVTHSELDNAAYITNADLPDYSNTYQAKGDYVTPEIMSAQSYVTHDYLSAQAYLTSVDLPDYSNTYQAKGDYITPTDLDNAAYITNADLPDYSNTYQAKGDYLTSETDPIFTASVAATITQSDIDNWNRGGSIDLSSYVTYNYLSAQSYATNARLNEVEFVSTKAITYIYDKVKTAVAPDLSAYVSKTELTAQSYVTQVSLSNNSYVTQTSLSNNSYVTQTLMSAQSYVTQASLSSNSYITSAQFVFDASTATLHITI